MGIIVEFNPDLCLRRWFNYVQDKRTPEECVPEPLNVGETYEFLKRGQRVYYLEDEVPLRLTDGEFRTRPLASVRILTVTHYWQGRAVYTKGTYQVIAVFSTEDSLSHFDGLERRLLPSPHVI